MKTKILVSACLLGERVRYDGADNSAHHDVLTQWQNEGRIVAVCPEVMGGLPVPRPPAELQFVDGAQALDGQGSLLTVDGADVTDAFIQGAQRALEIAQRHNCHYALLAARSPSCGNREIYDGSFSGRLVPGQGVTASLLTSHGIQVFNQHEIDALVAQLT